MSAEAHMSYSVKNIFTPVETIKGEEAFATVFENSALRIEKIVSHSHSSPKGFWYDQSADEWVIVLRGAATLEFAGGELVEMEEGDYVAIPRHARHRVRQTSEETIWLAVHLK
jgi:cupin 2 domain-containing protein